MIGLAGGRVYVNSGVSLVPQVSDPVYGLAVNMLLSCNVMQVSFLPILCFVQHTMSRKPVTQNGEET